MPSRLRRCALFALLALLTQFAVPPGVAAADPQPDAVSVPGSFGSEVGCAGDWQPECAAVAGQKYTLDPLQKSGSDLV